MWIEREIFKLFSLEYEKIVYCFDAKLNSMHKFQITELRENFIAWKSISAGISAARCTTEWFFAEISIKC